MIVQCVDRKYYTNPHWHATKYVILFEAECLVMIAKNKNTHNLPIKVGRGVLGWGSFPPKWENVKAKTYDIKLLGLMPIPQSWDECFEEPAYWDLEYCFEVSFPTSRLWEAYLTGDEIVESYLGKGWKRKLKNLIGKMTFEEYTLRFGDNFVLRRLG